MESAIFGLFLGIFEFPFLSLSLGRAWDEKRTRHAEGLEQSLPLEF